MIPLPLWIIIFHSRMSWWGCGFMSLVTLRGFILHMLLSLPLSLCKLFVSTPSSSDDFHRPPSHFMTVSFRCFEVWYPDLLPLVLTLAMRGNLLAFLFLPLLSCLLLGLYNHTFCLFIDGETNLLQYLWKAEHQGVEQSKFFQLHFIICHWNLSVLFLGYIAGGLVDVLWIY